MTRSTWAAVAAGTVVFLWLAGQVGYAVIAVLVAVAVYAVDRAVFDEVPCGCDKGTVWSPLTRSARRCRKCGDTKGFRKRRGGRSG